METIATAVPTIIADIPTMDIKELSRDVFQEYTDECKNKGKRPNYKLEHLPTFYAPVLSSI